MSASENPYEAPKTVDTVHGIRSGSREDLRKIAVDQKGILVCMLLYFVGVVGQFLLPPEYRIFVAVPVLLIGLAAMVFVIMLTVRIKGVGMAVLMGVLTIVPCLGLIMLFVVNNEATKVLTANGYKVGFLGADLSQFPARG